MGAADDAGDDAEGLELTFFTDGKRAVAGIFRMKRTPASAVEEALAQALAFVVGDDNLTTLRSEGAIANEDISLLDEGGHAIALGLKVKGGLSVLNEELVKREPILRKVIGNAEETT